MAEQEHFWEAIAVTTPNKIEQEDEGQTVNLKNSGNIMVVFALVGVLFVFLHFASQHAEPQIKPLPPSGSSVGPEDGIIAGPNSGQPWSTVVQSGALTDDIVLLNMDSLKSVPMLEKGEFVDAQGLVVDVLDRPGVPYRVTLADESGFATVSVMSPTQALKNKVAIGRWLRIPSQIDEYKGNNQLVPISVSLVSDLTETTSRNPPKSVEAVTGLRGSIVHFTGSIRSIRYIGSGGAAAGELVLPSGDLVSFLWPTPPENCLACLTYRGFGSVGEYRGSDQIKLITSSASIVYDEFESRASVGEVVQLPPSSLSRVYGTVVRVQEKPGWPLIATLADQTAGVEMLIDSIEPDQLTELKRIMTERGAVSIEAKVRVSTYRNARQLQLIDLTNAVGVNPSDTIPTLTESSELVFGRVFYIRGAALRSTRRNSRGGLSGDLYLANLASLPFVWWDAPSNQKTFTGFVKVGEFRGVQLELIRPYEG